MKSRKVDDNPVGKSEDTKDSASARGVKTTSTVERKMKAMKDTLTKFPLDFEALRK